MPERRVLYEPKDDLRAWLAAVAQPGLRPSMSDGRRADAGASVLTACAVACSPVDALPADPDRVEAREEDVNRRRCGDHFGMPGDGVPLRVAAEDLGDAVDDAWACGGDKPGCQGTRAVAQ